MRPAAAARKRERSARESAPRRRAGRCLRLLALGDEAAPPLLVRDAAAVLGVLLVGARARSNSPHAMTRPSRWMSLLTSTAGAISKTSGRAALSRSFGAIAAADAARSARSCASTSSRPSSAASSSSGAVADAANAPGAESARGSARPSLCCFLASLSSKSSMSSISRLVAFAAVLGRGGLLLLGAALDARLHRAAAARLLRGSRPCSSPFASQLERRALLLARAQPVRVRLHRVLVEARDAFFWRSRRASTQGGLVVEALQVVAHDVVVVLDHAAHRALKQERARAVEVRLRRASAASTAACGRPSRRRPRRAR